MPLGFPTGTWWLAGRVLTGLSLVAALAVSGLALYGARRNDSRSMLALGGGIATLTVGSWVVSVLGYRLFPTGAVGLAAGSATELVGLALILYAIVLARRE